MTAKSKKLRSGYTTGANAAAAAKAATVLLLRTEEQKKRKTEPSGPGHHNFRIKEVGIPFPDGKRVEFRINESGFRTKDNTAWASVIKDAGDDPDVTNKAEIVAEVSFLKDTETLRHDDPETCLNSFSPLSRFTGAPSLIIRGGKGVGIVTKPGLAIPVGEPAINPVPRRMITDAVREAVEESRLQAVSCKSKKNNPTDSSPAACHEPFGLEVTISVPEGGRLAKRTLNSRLGIEGGISILGTTGIVRPLSSEAWTASITAAMDVARAMGREEVVLSSGRSSERLHMEKYRLPVESYVMMGDYVEFSLLDSVKHGFKKIHLCAQWAKTLKIAMTTPQTHVRHGAIEMKKTVRFLNSIGVDMPQDIEFNTAREMHDLILTTFRSPEKAFITVCDAAKKYAEKITGPVPVITNLVLYNGDIIVKDD